MGLGGAQESMFSTEFKRPLFWLGWGRSPAGGRRVQSGTRGQEGGQAGPGESARATGGRGGRLGWPWAAPLPILGTPAGLWDQAAAPGPILPFQS